MDRVKEREKGERGREREKGERGRKREREEERGRERKKEGERESEKEGERETERVFIFKRNYGCLGTFQLSNFIIIEAMLGTKFKKM
jgi:hypothetical protein